MKKFLQKRLGNEKGLTLVELLAVIVILGIIAAIAIPSIGGIIQGSREKAVIADAQNALSAASLYFVDNDSADITNVELATLIADDYMEDAGKLTVADTKVFKSTGTGLTKTGHNIDGAGDAGKKTVKFNTATKSDLTEKKTAKVVFTNKP